MVPLLLQLLLPHQHQWWICWVMTCWVGQHQQQQQQHRQHHQQQVRCLATLLFGRWAQACCAVSRLAVFCHGSELVCSSVSLLLCDLPVAL
jgi:hypothetical protein